MNNPISWDPSLVKKFSSSNYYKLINQLRNEVIKYPLNNKKNTTVIQSKETIQDNKNKETFTNSQNDKISKKTDQNNESATNNTTISFNNSKNFSIYNKANNYTITQSETDIPDTRKSNNDLSSPTFKERLNQIDMK